MDPYAIPANLTPKQYQRLLRTARAEDRYFHRHFHEMKAIIRRQRARRR